MIELKHVNKVFHEKNRSVEAVKDVSLTIEKGEIYGIIGFSGAGKSTLVRCINLLERPTSGQVFVDGVELTALSPRMLRHERKKIGMIFQQFNLMASRTVFQNIALPLQYNGISKEDIRKRVLELLEFVDLSDKRDAYPSQLSGGQKQRVAIARALASRPEVLLCDEATSALDPQTTRSILELLKKLNQQLGITIVVITHEMQVIKKVCDRVAVMENGAVVEEGDVFSVFSNPQQPITKNFINTTSNLAEVERLIEENSPLVRLTSGSKILRLRYVQESVSEPLISYISSKFNLQFNIIFSDVELIGDRPLGGTVGIVSGNPDDMNHAITWLKEKGISVEVIKDAGTN
jgi:D-methionine transport system ATP-binding protein